jgi:hypothetical protein
MTSICVSFSIILISTLLATLRQIKLFRCCFQLFSYLSRFRNLPYDLLFLLILIFVFVSWILIRSMSHLYSKKRNSCVRVANLIWTISTCILRLSSFSSCLVEIVYCMDQEAHVHMVDHPAPAPTVSETKERLRDFLSSFGKRRAYSSFINRISEELDLEHASPGGRYSK